MNVQTEDQIFVTDLIKHFIAVIREYETNQGREILFDSTVNMTDGRILTTELTGAKNE